MRVLVLTQYYPPEVGGAQTRLAAFASEMMRHGHEVEVVTAMPQHLLGRTYTGYRRRFYMRETIDGVLVRRAWAYAATGKGIARAANYLSFSLTSLPIMLTARRPDIVFTESPPLTLGITGWIASIVHGAPLVFNVSDLWPDSVRDLGVISDGALLRSALRLEGFLYRRATIVNAVTRGIARTLLESKGVAAQKICFFPNGVDVERFAPRPPDQALRVALDIGDLPVLLYAGTHGFGMGLEHALDAARLLENEAAVVFVGAGPTKAALVERARALRVRNVRFVEPVRLEQMPRYYSIAFAALVPLIRATVTLDARPSKLFPALASAVPILYSGEGEGAQLVTNAGAGIAVQPEDGDAIAAGMRAMLADRSSHARMARNGRRLAETEFSWQAIVSSWLESLGERLPPSVRAKSPGLGESLSSSP